MESIKSQLYVWAAVHSRYGLGVQSLLCKALWETEMMLMKSTTAFSSALASTRDECVNSYTSENIESESSNDESDDDLYDV